MGGLELTEISMTISSIVLIYIGIKKTKRDLITYAFMLASCIWLIYLFFKILL